MPILENLVRFAVAAVLAVCVGVPGLAQSAAPFPESAVVRNAQGTAVIAGTVRDAATGEALAKVEVRLSGGPPGGSQPGSPAAGAMTARTGPDGVFRLENVAAGDYALVVSRRAYSVCGAQVQGLPGRSQACAIRFSLRAGQKLETVDIRMLRAAVVTGQVVDEDGEPMAGVVVEAEQYRYLRGNRLLTASSRATTDDRGQYRIFNLSPGRYFLKAQGRGLIARLAGAVMNGGPGRMGAMQGQGGQGPGALGRGGFAALEDAITYPATYYPAGEFPEEAIPLQLAPGAEMGGIDFRLSPSATFFVHGTVTGATGEPMTGIVVTARRVGSVASLVGATSFASVDSRTGAFTLRGVTPGRYELVARSRGMRRENATTPSASGSVIVDVASLHVEGVVIPLRPDTALRGEVRLPKDSPETPLERMRIQLDSGLPGPRRLARVEATGQFSLTVAAADALLFSLEGLPEGFYVQAMRLGGVDLMAPGAIPPSEIAGDFIIQLASNGGSVSGMARLADGKVASGARVVLLPETTGQALALWRQTTLTGDDGAFQFSAVAPGRYRVFLFEDLEPGPAQDPDFLAQFGPRWKAVEIKPSSSAQVEPVLIPASDSALLLGEIAQ
ncbi:MAG: carboxypeptidase-like regulatory domain-containing protein [Bryobacterales bacterium]|jgi:protocatechuate 3,4-dioxygenase beta subunit|nr:carboxypeptidase-like regulatory domain-containing protein [Bryobacterales bacterium]